MDLNAVATMKTIIPFLVILIGLTSAPPLSAQSTAFTYHGVLSLNRTPVTGEYDMRFAIYEAEMGGVPTAGPLTKNAVGVTNGLFTARLDFLGGVFTGPPRWIEVSVRPAGNGNFQTLSPRQELTSSPYSIRSLTAGTATDVANGSVVKSLNNLKDDVTLAAGANVTLTPNGNTLIIASSGASGVWSLNGNDAFYNGGNVGIGTSSPAERLTIAGVPSYNNGLKLTGNADGGTGMTLENTSAGGHRYSLLSGGVADGVGVGGFGIFDDTIGDYRLGISALGNVGIGTAIPARKLTVFSSFYGIEHTDGSVRLGTYLNVAGAYFGTVSNDKLHFYVNDGGASMTVDTTGNVGIGNSSPTTKLDVAGDVRGTRLILRADPLASANAAVLCEDPNVSNFVPFNTANGRPLNVIVRDAFVRVLTINGGADIAEPFQMSSSEIPKGAVVVIDAQKPGHLKMSQMAYDTRVAGVVSGANGIKPGISLHQEGALEGGENVALSGRVYVQADATSGAIRPGDLLTTSDTPGHAMKVIDHAKAQGAILGKAMTELNEGKGMVLVLVTLQ
jgi:hypothetical protein